MEYWDVYTRDAVFTGRIVEKGHKFTGEDYHIAVEAWIVNSKNEFLIQQRSMNVEILPGVWAMTTGRIKSGEVPINACVREVSEELGIKTFTPDDLTHIYHFVSEPVHMIWDLFLMEWNGSVDELDYSDNEVGAAKWVSEAELRRMLANNEIYVYDEVYEVIDIIKGIREF